MSAKSSTTTTLDPALVARLRTLLKAANVEAVNALPQLLACAERVEKLEKAAAQL